MRPTKYAYELDVHMAGQLRTLKHVKMTKNPSDDWIIDREEDTRLRKIVAADILEADQETMSMEELRFFMSLFKLKQNQIADILGLSESSISKWKNREIAALTKIESSKLQEHFVELLSDLISKEDMIDSALASRNALKEAADMFDTDSNLSPVTALRKTRIRYLRARVNSNFKFWFEFYRSHRNSQLIDRNEFHNVRLIRNVLGSEDYELFLKEVENDVGDFVARVRSSGRR